MACARLPSQTITASSGYCKAAAPWLRREQLEPVEMQRASALDITHRDADMPVKGPADPADSLIEFPLLRRQRRGFDRLASIDFARCRFGGIHVMDVFKIAHAPMLAAFQRTAAKSQGSKVKGLFHACGHLIA